MKKVFGIIIALILFTICSGNFIFAQDNSTMDRKSFIEEYLNKMDVILDLVKQTETARDKNNDLSKQIKNNFNNEERTTVKSKVDEIRNVQQTNRDLVDQAKTYINNRNDARNNWQNAVKNRDTELANTYRNQIDDLTSKIKDVRSEIKTNKDKIDPLINDVRNYRNNNKTKIDNAAPLFEKITATQLQITNKINEKDRLWITFSDNIRAKSYDSALSVMDQIITLKKEILDDINSKNSVLNEILELQRT